MSARRLFFALLFPLIFINLLSCGNNQRGKGSSIIAKLGLETEEQDQYNPVNAMLVIPRNPVPGEGFRILATGGRNIRKAKIIVRSPSGNLESLKSKNGEELPFWRIDDFAGSPAGKYKAALVVDKKEVCSIEFEIPGKMISQQGMVWKTVRGWDSSMETIYSAWINALFQDCGEQASWPALHDVTRDKDRNFLYNYLSLNEDDGNSGLTWNLTVPITRFS